MATPRIEIDTSKKFRDTSGNGAAREHRAVAVAEWQGAAAALAIPRPDHPAGVARAFFFVGRSVQRSAPQQDTRRVSGSTALERLLLHPAMRCAIFSGVALLTIAGDRPTASVGAT